MNGKEQQAVIKANNLFAIELYSQLKVPEENLFFSPFSIFTALAMVYSGARGLTATNMEDILHISVDQYRFHMTFKEVLSYLRGEDDHNKDSELHIANLLCIQKGYELIDKFLNIINENYKGATWELDFKNVKESCAKINTWVAEQTRGKIKNIIDTVEEEMGLILVNAIYFKGTWDIPFKKNLTEDENFSLFSGEKILVPMMRQTGNFGYLEQENLQILEMPYKGRIIFGRFEHISMIIFLPKTFNGIELLESVLTVERINEYIANLEKQKVKVFFPRFSMSSKYLLVKHLSGLGMSNPFNINADFSGIAKDPPKGISQVIHKAYIEVNEKGTEAAAVTALGVLGASIPHIKPPEPPIFRADHPFLFVIQDSLTKTILFLGKLMNPS